MTDLRQAAINLLAAIEAEPRSSWAPNANRPKWEREVYGPAVRALRKAVQAEPIFDDKGEYRAEGKGYSVFAKQEMGRGVRYDARTQPLVVDFSGEPPRRISSRENEQRGRSFGFVTLE